MNMQPCVLIYNPISGHGHLDSWNALFIFSLLQRGWYVLALTPDTCALLSRLEQKGIYQHRNLQILAWNSHHSLAKKNIRVLWPRWNNFGDCYYYKKPGSEANSTLTFFEFWKRRLFQYIIPIAFRGSHYFYACYQKLKIRLQRKRITSHTQDPEVGMMDPVELAKSVCAALKNIDRKPDLVLNMYMDAYRTHLPEWQHFDLLNRLPWAGIRFVPREEPNEAWWTLCNWRGMGLLDKDVYKKYCNLLPDKIFCCLPDITETVLPENQNKIVSDILERAQNRQIVFLGGAIGGQKNLSQWLRLVQLADPGKWFFVQVGEIIHDTLSKDDILALNAVLTAPYENLFIHDTYLEDERVFNEIISVCDIIFAVYRDFKISSNMLSKSANFKKPILVSNRYMLGEYVSKYKIGKAVNENSPADMLTAIEDLQLSPIPDSAFDKYNEIYSHEKLGDCLEQFLTLCIAAD